MGISKKSINIKKSRLPSKFDLIKSPIRKPIGSHTDHSMHALKNNKIMPSKIPKILYQEEKKLTELNMDFTKNENNKENVTRVLQRRKSKTADEVLIKKSNEPKVSFMSPQISLSKDHKALLPLRKSLLEKEIDKKTPGKFISSTPSTYFSFCIFHHICNLVFLIKIFSYSQIYQQSQYYQLKCLISIKFTKSILNKWILFLIT